jgi:hypothetical protein
MYSQVDTSDQFDLASFEVDSGYVKSQIDLYEEKYRAEFSHGWGEFFAAYSKGLTDNSNLDYDEWAFLCEHFMHQSWTPPERLEMICHERPEAISGLSILGGSYCLIPMRTSRNWTAF